MALVDTLRFGSHTVRSFCPLEDFDTGSMVENGHKFTVLYIGDGVLSCVSFHLRPAIFITAQSKRSILGLHPLHLDRSIVDDGVGS